jgi:antitoxin HigA-1
VSTRKKTAIHIHPGEVLKEEFLAPHGVTGRRLALAVGVPASRIYGVLKGSCRITAEMAILLARAFQTTPEFWINLQARYDLEIARSTMSVARLSRAAKAATRLRS